MGGGTAVDGRPDVQKESRMLRSQRSDGTVAGSTKRLTSRFYQMKMGHCLTGQYLHWAKSHPTAPRWWCRCQADEGPPLLGVLSGRSSRRYRGQRC